VTALAALLLAAPAARALDVGDPMPPITVKKWVANTPVSASNVKGKVVVVEFWATWCGPCRQSIPHLNKLYEEYEKKGVILCGITREEEATVTGFIKTMPMKYHVGLDAGKTHADYMQGIGGIPHAFLIDRKGKVAWHGHPMSGLDQQIAKLVAAGPAVSDDPVEAAMELSTSSDFAQRDLPKALELARQAYEKSGRKDAKALAALARVHYEMGHVATAAKAAEAALKLGTDDEKEALEAAAEFYKKELERRKKDPAASL